MGQNTEINLKPTKKKNIMANISSNVLHCLSIYNQVADEHISKTSCDELSVMILIRLEAQLFALQNS